MESFIGNVNEKGVVHRFGHDYGTVDGDQALVVHSVEGRFVILKWKGHTAWSGRGQQDYFATRFIVIECESIDKISRREDGSISGFTGSEVVQFQATGQKT